ncbi:MAG: hypothetical protein ACK559_09425, partial [bacterium]
VRHRAAAQELPTIDRDVGELVSQRDLPRVGARVRLRQRDLLLPRDDAGHERMLDRRMRQAVTLHPQPLRIRAQRDAGAEHGERLRLPRKAFLRERRGRGRG